MTSHEHLRDIFNERRKWWQPDFDQTVQFANEGKHGSYMKLKRLMKEIRNEQKASYNR